MASWPLFLFTELSRHLPLLMPCTHTFNRQHYLQNWAMTLCVYESVSPCICITIYVCVHVYMQYTHWTMSHISLAQCLFLLSRDGNLLYLDFKYLQEGLIKNLNFSFGHADQILPTISVMSNTESDPVL